MKHTTLLLTLLLSAPLIAQMSFDEAKQKIATAQARYDETRSRIEKQRASAEREHKLTESIAGKHEYAEDIKKRTERLRTKCDMHNQAVEKELKTALEHLQTALAEVGPHHTIVSEGDKYSVMPPAEAAAKPAPIVQRSAATSTTRLPYETRRTRTVSRSMYPR